MSSSLCFCIRIPNSPLVRNADKKSMNTANASKTWWKGNNKSGNANSNQSCLNNLIRTKWGNHSNKCQLTRCTVLKTVARCNRRTCNKLGNNKLKWARTCTTLNSQCKQWMCRHLISRRLSPSTTLISCLQAMTLTLMTSLVEAMLNHKAGGRDEEEHFCIGEVYLFISYVQIDKNLVVKLWKIWTYINYKPILSHKTKIFKFFHFHSLLNSTTLN